MPELPEVHTTVTILNKILPGLKIRGVWCDWPKTIKNPKTLSVFKKQMVGRKVLSVSRRGKNVLINLSGGKTLLIHMKMTGSLRYKKPEEEIRFVHLIFSLSNGRELALADMRKFAKVLIWDTDKLDELEDLKKVGPDPLEKKFTFVKFKNILINSPFSPRLRKGKIKEVLMRQELISGIGNIYASELLWDAGIYPFKDVSELSDKELQKIYRAMRQVLNRGVKLKGDSVVDYLDPFGRKGRYQNYHKAYKREGGKCARRDGGIILRVKKGSRSTFYCSVHQRKQE